MFHCIPKKGSPQVQVTKPNLSANRHFSLRKRTQFFLKSNFLCPRQAKLAFGFPWRFSNTCERIMSPPQISATVLLFLGIHHGAIVRTTQKEVIPTPAAELFPLFENASGDVSDLAYRINGAFPTQNLLPSRVRPCDIGWIPAQISHSPLHWIAETAFALRPRPHFQIKMPEC